MGGIVCEIPKSAILRFDGVPADRRKLAKFDEQLRQCYAQPQIVQGIADAGHGYRVCKLLSKTRGWDDGERQDLYGMLIGLYAHDPGTGD
jgi:hypothetical protein